MLVLAQAGGSSPFPWAAVIGIPGGILAVIGLISYFVGVIRPLAVKRAVTACDGTETRLRLAVTNRSFLFDRNVDAIVLLHRPSLWKRVRHRDWRERAQPEDHLPWGDDLPTAKTPTTLSKRQEASFDVEIRTKAGAKFTSHLDDQVRVEAHSGRRRSKSRKLTHRALT